MANLNKVILIGRLTADPELRHTQSNLSVTSFTVAVNRGYRKQGEEQKTDFIDVVAWDKRAEFLCQYFRKGMPVLVTGSLQVRTWKDNQDNNRKSTEVIADEIQFVESKKDGARPQSNDVTFSTGTAGDFEEMSSDDELPF